MSDFEKQSFNNPNDTPDGSTVERTPHAGHEGVPDGVREVPIYEFDTPMDKAVAKGHLNPKAPEVIPTNMVDTVYSTEQQPQVEIASEEKKTDKKTGLGVKLATVAAGIAVTGGAIFGGVALAHSGDSAPEKEATDTTEVQDDDSGEIDYEAANEAYEASLPNEQELVEMFSIPSGISDQETAEHIVKNIDNWQNFGANELLGPASDGWDDRDSRYVEISQKAGEDIAPIFFNPDYKSNQMMTMFTDQITGNDAVTLELHDITSNKQYDKEAWYTWSKVTNVKEITSIAANEDEKTLHIDFTMYDNSDKNRADELTEAEQFPEEGVPMQINVTLTDSGDRQVITGFVYGQNASAQ